MKVIVFIAILGLALAGLRGDKKKVPHSIHDLMPHHHATHHASKTSGHGHGHGSSNSENSEELFNLLGMLQGDLQGTIDTIKGDIQGTINTLTGDVQGTIAQITAPSKSTKSGVSLKKLPHSIPHMKGGKSGKSGKSSGHDSSNSENSEELFNIIGAIDGGIANAIQGTTDTITADLQGTADTINGALQGTAATICNNAQGVLCDDAQGTADTVGGDLVGTADTLNPIINATGTDIAYATDHLNTTIVQQDINDGIALTGTAIGTAGQVAKLAIKAGELAAAAGAAFVDIQGMIQNDIQGTIDTIQGDIQGTVDTIQGDLQGTANTVTQAVESITPAEAAATGNAIASTIGTGLVIGNDALKDVNDGLSIANSVIP